MGEAVEIAIRTAPQNRRAIILVHGFSGEAHTTFGMLPAFLAGDDQLSSWDLHCFGYPTRLAPDITGVWSSDPNLTNLAQYFGQAMNSTYRSYAELAIVAHSMGGLIVQRALLDSGFSARTSHVVCMGTPSGGLRKARLARIFKQQARDMTPDGSFITALRADWKTKQALFKFSFLVVAGLGDQFVPTRSSHEPFEEKYRAHVPGNHLEMVKPVSRESPSVKLLLDHLLSRRADASVLPVAVTGSVVEQALSLELLGREQQAIDLLRQHVAHSTDVQGALAGRLKRRWLRDPEHNLSDGQEALDTYSQAYAVAAAAQDHDQAYYNGINQAFMQLAMFEDLEPAAQTARQVLDHTRRASDGPWRKATEAEALLHLREPASALAAYRHALSALGPRERASMLQQAIWTTRLLGESFVETQLEALLVTSP